MKIRKDDRVIVMSGKDVGATGKVLVVDPEAQRVKIEGINQVHRHLKVRPTQRGGQTGGITRKENWVHISNVQLVCSSCGQPTRVRHRVNDDGSKQRVCAKCGAVL